MKKSLLLLFSLFTFFLSQAQQPFITTWEVTAGDLEILIPTNTNIYTYNYTIDFGDGTILTNQDDDIYYTYSSPGVYTVSISGLFPHFYGIELDSFILQNNYAYKLKSIEQWGDNQWLNMYGMFRSCLNMISNATDIPDLSNVSSLGSMFSNAKSFNQNINDWDVSNVTDMSDLFNFAESFNQPLNNWNVSNVTDMSGLFKGAESYNQDLNNWDVSNVTNMTFMFSRAKVFNQPLNSWDVSSVTNMTYMLHKAENFNQPLNNWDVFWVTSMYGMFASAYNFNRNINSWNISNLTEAGYMFNDATNFNQPLNSWNTSNVENMSWMFAEANSFNQNINNWDVSNVNYMRGLFSGAESFNQPLNNWDVSNVTNMSNMFSNAKVFNQPLNSWDVSSVVDMTSMFFEAENFNEPLYDWNISSVVNMSWIFSRAYEFNQDLSNWNFQTNSLISIISNTSMNKENYDLLIERLVNLNLTNGNLGAFGVYYCDNNTRQELINLGWSITDSGQHPDCILSTNAFLLSKIRFYPNPVSDRINLELPAGLNLKSIDLFDIQGKRIKTFEGQLELYFNNIPQGIYILKLETDKGSYHHKIIKE